MEYHERMIKCMVNVAYKVKPVSGLMTITATNEPSEY